jgi:hypothetical protein
MNMRESRIDSLEASALRECRTPAIPFDVLVEPDESSGAELREQEKRLRERTVAKRK